MSVMTYNGRHAAIADDDSDDLPHVADARKNGRMRYSLARAMAMACQTRLTLSSSLRCSADANKASAWRA